MKTNQIVKLKQMEILPLSNQRNVCIIIIIKKRAFDACMVDFEKLTYTKTAQKKNFNEGRVIEKNLTLRKA